MPSKIDARLAELGITLPDAPVPVATYVPHVVSGPHGLRLGPGQPRRQRADHRQARRRRPGRAGCRRRRAPARSQLIAHLRNACDGDLDRVKRVVKLTGFVNSAPDFTDQPKVINGCSEVMIAVFGDEGRHARSAVGVAALPLGVAVEVEGVFEIA